TTPDPDRGYALAAITGALSFRHAKPGIIRALIAERTDEVLFELSWDYVGDLSETVALMWPVSQHAPSAPLSPRSGGEGSGVGGPPADSSAGLLGEAPAAPDPSPPRVARAGRGEHTALAVKSATNAPTLSHVVTTLASLGKSELP